MKYDRTHRGHVVRYLSWIERMQPVIAMNSACAVKLSPQTGICTQQAACHRKGPCRRAVFSALRPSRGLLLAHAGKLVE
jgi:hypothetical protein